MKARISNLLNVWRRVKAVGWKAAWREWVYAYAMLDTPENIQIKKLFSYGVNLAGLVVIIAFFVFTRRWLYVAAVVGTFLIFYYQAKLELKQYVQLKSIKRQAEELYEREIKGLEAVRDDGVSGS